MRLRDKPTLRKILLRHWHYLLDLIYPPLPDETAERWRLQKEVQRLLGENDKLRRELIMVKGPRHKKQNKKGRA